RRHRSLVGDWSSDVCSSDRSGPALSTRARMRRLHLWDPLTVERMRALVESAGPLGPLVFIGIFIAGFFLPGPEIIMVAFGGVLRSEERRVGEECGSRPSRGH